MKRALAALAIVGALVGCSWHRAITYAPAARSALGADLWPFVVGPAEPLDCDEAVYAHIGRRLLAGDAMYRDLTENKPPLGYALYALAVKLGGAEETAIRVMSLPYVLGTIVLLAATAWRLGGPWAGGLAAWAYAFASADPYVFGNGSTMEQFVNLFAVGALFLATRPGAWSLAGAGALTGLAALVKQPALLPIALYLVVALASAPRWRRTGALMAGLAAPLVVAGAVLAWQGAIGDAFADVVRYGGALATDVPPDPNAPPGWARWLTGNADPREGGPAWDAGGLPWPFGSTDYYVWWGAGLWPLWLASAMAWPWIAFGSKRPGRRLLAAWVALAWAQVVLPGLYWPHYYLLALPGAVLTVSLALSDFFGLARKTRWALVPALALAASLVGALAIQVRDYVLVPPEVVTARYKGGAQWVALRKLGRELRERAKDWEPRRILIWGWQSPLYVYGDLNGCTRQVFVDPLLKAHAGGAHPIVAPRLARTMRDVEASPPELVFAGDPPFPALRRFLDANYVLTMGGGPEGRGLWARADKAGDLGRLGGAN